MRRVEVAVRSHELPATSLFIRKFGKRKKEMPMKSIYCTIIAAAGSFLTAQFGVWDAALETLVCFMAIDWITGGVLLPIVFKKSPKSENGTLESRAGWKGLCRKGMMLFFVLIAEKLDQLTQTNYLRDAVCIGFILNEAVSILENAGLMGVKIPEILRSRIDVLRKEEQSK